MLSGIRLELRDVLVCGISASSDAVPALMWNYTADALYYIIKSGLRIYASLCTAGAIDCTTWADGIMKKIGIIYEKPINFFASCIVYGLVLA